MELLKQDLIKRGYKEVQKLIDKFILYRELLINENKKYNLTAITQAEQVELKHFIDSIQAEKIINGSIIDIGTGAGFPSIPLAILKKDCFFTLIDSQKKRTDFLELVKKELELENIEIFHKRIEDFDKNKKFDCALSRAVAPLNILCEYSLPFVKKDKIMLAYKGSNYIDEIQKATNALNILGAKIEKIHTYILNIDEEINRCIIQIKKINDCPNKYPRKLNKARLSPL